MGTDRKQRLALAGAATLIMGAGSVWFVSRDGTDKGPAVLTNEPVQRNVRPQPAVSSSDSRRRPQKTSAVEASKHAGPIRKVRKPVEGKRIDRKRKQRQREKRQKTFDLKRCG